MSKFFTIITATYNAASTLPRLLDSLAEQTCRDFNVIIQDGASQDNTVAIAESYRDRLPELLLESTPDTGIYDAWNKAIDRCQDKLGEWVLFLGADDRLVSSDVLDMVFDKIKNLEESIKFVSGDVELNNGSGERIIQKGLHINVQFELSMANPAVHSALFHNRKLFITSKFNTSFRISADHDFVASLWKKDTEGVYLNFSITEMMLGGLSSSIDNVLRFRWDLSRIITKHFGIKYGIRFVVPIMKGVVLHILCIICGKKVAMKIHNRMRYFFGKMPAWYDR